MIEFKQVSKSFGKVKALDDVNFIFPTGKITGLFGPNGAGKSTSLKLIMGINRPDRGEILIDGNPPHSRKHELAFMPEIDYLYNWMNIAQAANFIRCFYTDWDQQKYQNLLKFLNLSEDMKINKISKGQRTKTKLLLTASRRARYILLDEPLSGIDVLTREEIINTLVHDYHEGQQTIIISTHEIAEIESLVDEVIFIGNGRVRLADNAENLREQKGMSLVDVMKEEFKNA